MIDFFFYRSKGFNVKTALRLSATQNKRIWAAVKFIIVVSAFVYLISDMANATVATSDIREETISQNAEIEALRKIVGACVSDSSAGGLLKIGEEYYLCGISPLGSFGSRKVSDENRSH